MTLADRIAAAQTAALTTAAERAILTGEGTAASAGPTLEDLAAAHAAVATGRAQILAALRHVAALTSRPVCGTPRPDVSRLITTAEHVVSQGWDVEKVVIREEYCEPTEATAGGWVWAIYRDDDAMMTELHRRAFSFPF